MPVRSNCWCCSGLLIPFILFLSVTERELLNSLVNIVDLSVFSFQFSSVFASSIWSYITGCIHIQECYIIFRNSSLIIMKLTPFNLSALKCSLSDINIVIPSFFFLKIQIYMVYIFHAYIFNMFVSLYLNMFLLDSIAGSPIWQSLPFKWHI